MTPTADRAPGAAPGGVSGAPTAGATRRPRRPSAPRTAAGKQAPPPARRTADEIGRTSMGPRPVPALTPTRRVRVPALADTVLDSGLRVIAVRKPGTPLVEIRLRIPFAGAGTRHVARAELLAATLLLGTERRNREQVDAELADVGGHLDTDVDPQRLLITGSVLATGLGALLEVLADCLIDPAFRRTDVAGERERLVEHLAIAAAQPSTIARQHLQRRRFGDHPAALDMPDPDAVAAVGPAAIRGLHAKAVVPQGATLVLAGDLSPARTLELIARALSGWRTPGSARLLAPPPPIQPADIAAFDRPGAVQSQVRLTAGAVSRDDPRYPAYQLANLVYGGYFSSRLVENIREDKGYTYGAHSVLEFWPSAAAVTVAFDTNTDSTAPALLEARYELGRISVVPPSAAEIDAARNYALGTLATSLATQAGYASTLSALAGVGLDVEWVREHPVHLAAVTPAEVAGAAAEMLAPTRFTGVVVGDLAAIGGGLTALGGVQLP